MTLSRKTLVTLLALSALTLCSLVPGVATAASEGKRTKAIDKLAYAIEEIDIVIRAADEGKLSEARKQYKRAKDYFLDAMKGIRAAKPSQTEREQTEVYEDRFRKIDRDPKELDEETVHEVSRLFHEAHEFFDPNATR